MCKVHFSNVHLKPTVYLCYLPFGNTNTKANHYIIMWVLIVIGAHKKDSFKYDSNVHFTLKITVPINVTVMSQISQKLHTAFYFDNDLEDAFDILRLYFMLKLENILVISLIEVTATFFLPLCFGHAYNRILKTYGMYVRVMCSIKIVQY